jgi:class 3 adenylate cyclase
VIACHACDAQNPERARFCMACGARLDTSGADSKTSRRVVTVLFGDIVDSTELAQLLDPETLREVLFDYFAAMQPTTSPTSHTS